MARHKQVPFITLDDDEVVGVDSGMIDVLNALKALGIRTTFSCQNDGTKKKQAYIMIPTMDAIRLEKIMKDSSFFARLFGGSQYTRTALYFRTKKVYGNGSCGTRVHTIWKHETDTDPKNSYQIERLYDNVWGFRTVYRWPAKETAAFWEALVEAL